MRTLRLAAIVLALLGLTTTASAQSRWRKPNYCPPAPCPPTGTVALHSPLDPTSPLSPTDPSSPSPAANSPFQEALASAGEGGTQPTGSYMPGFFGDLIGGGVQSLVGILFQSDGAFFGPEIIRYPDVAQASGLKISESDSPRPVDRFYYLYNMWGAIQTSPDPFVPLLYLNRHIVGFEKTFLGGDASVGMRIPFFSMAGNFAYQTGFTGDLSIILKYALVNNRQTGNVVSVGLVTTPPTGSSPRFTDPDGQRFYAPREFSTYIQPFFGYIYNVTERLYAQCFHAVAAATSSAQPTFMTNDVSFGYWLYRNPADQLIRGIIPTLEIHVNTPFNRREATTAEGESQMLDSVNLTTGFYVLLNRSTLGCAVGVPLAFGPHRVEALASYTLRF